MRNFFQRIPFIRITSLFTVGILISHYYNLNFRVLSLLITILVSVQLLLWFSGNFSKIKIQNFLLASLVVVSGSFYPDFIKTHNLPDFSKKEYFLAEVRQMPVEKEKSFQTILQIQNQHLNKPEKVLAYFSKNSFNRALNIGDQLVILVKPQPIVNRNNPFEFDYRSFINNKGIRFSVYLPEGTWLKTGIHINHLPDISENIRQKLLQILSARIPEKEERSVIEALTLGYREDLDPETKNYFASTGAMHVLAVSGLHVGLIYFILNFLFSGLKNNKAGRAVYPFFLILSLWFYSFLTGFSPSVQRATVMFTFVIVGESIRRPVNIFNSLSASVLVLMLINPHVIFDVGFQLSYLAVFGIVLIQPLFAKLVSVKNRILKAIWDLFTVSVAAQLATFPLGLFYFNQTSNVFWISNFVVIPAATLLMWLTFSFFAFSFVPVISNILAFILNRVTHLMVLALKFLSELPIAVTGGIVITSLQTWIIYGILTAFFIFILSKQKQGLFLCLIFLICFQVLELYHNLKLFEQQAVYVYNSPARPIHFVNGRKNYLFTTRNDSLSVSELEMVKRVQDHLRLDKPIVITGKIRCEKTMGDLYFTDSQIQFLNCRISFPANSSKGNLSVMIDRKRNSIKTSQAKNSSLENFSQITLKNDSAYCFCLEKN